MHFIRHWTEPANLLNDLNTGSNNNNRYEYHIFLLNLTHLIMEKWGIWDSNSDSYILLPLQLSTDL